MPKRSSKPRDLNKLAANIVHDATTEIQPDPSQEAVDHRNPAAVELGRRGGLKGGKARAAKLTPEERREAARRAAVARWSKQRPEGGE